VKSAQPFIGECVIVYCNSRRITQAEFKHSRTSAISTCISDCGYGTHHYH
jgi:AraC-like DNA-binding protein